MRVTYFILARTLGRVKIGKALDPEKRLTELQTGAPEELELLLCLPNKPPFEESQLHQRFKNYRVCGEWFEYRHDLKLFVCNKIQDPLPNASDDKAVSPTGKYAAYLDRAAQDRPRKTVDDPISERAHQLLNSHMFTRYDDETDSMQGCDPFDMAITQEWAREKIN